MSSQVGARAQAKSFGKDRLLGELLRQAAEALRASHRPPAYALRAETAQGGEMPAGNGVDAVGREPSPAFGDFLQNEFLPWSAEQHQARPRTHQRNRVSARPLADFLGGLRLDEISAAHVAIFKLVRAQEISLGGVDRELAVLRCLLNFAIGRGYLSQNPARGAKCLANISGGVRIVSPEEQKRYLAESTPLLLDVALLILETGLRPEEVYTIRREDIKPHTRELFVASGKTRLARRWISLTGTAWEILNRRSVEAKGDYLFSHRRDPNRPLLSLRGAHEEALRRADIRPPFRLYDLRHTYGVRAATAGADLATLKKQMGHSDICLTLRYVRPAPAQHPTH